MNDLRGGGVPDVMIVETCPKCSKSERSRKCGPAADSKWYALMVIQPKVSQVADTAISQVADTAVSSGGRY